MKIILILLFIDVAALVMILFQSCFIPQKGEWYEMKYVTLIDIHQTELGFDLLWKDDLRPYKQFTKDTTGCNYHIGSAYLIMIKQ